LVIDQEAKKWLKEQNDFFKMVADKAGIKPE